MTEAATLDEAHRIYLQRVVGELLTSAENAKDQYHGWTPLAVVSVLWLGAVGLAILFETRWDGLLALLVTSVAFLGAIRTYAGALYDPANGDRHVLVPTAVLLVLIAAALSQAVVRARSGGWLRYVHGFVAVVCVAALLATYYGMRTHFLLPAWGHVQTQAELSSVPGLLRRGTHRLRPGRLARGAAHRHRPPLGQAGELTAPRPRELGIERPHPVRRHVPRQLRRAGPAGRHEVVPLRTRSQPRWRWPRRGPRRPRRARPTRPLRRPPRARRRRWSRPGRRGSSPRPREGRTPRPGSASRAPPPPRRAPPGSGRPPVR